MRVVVFGCGGVGSHLAYFLSKIKNDGSRIDLEDYDLDRIYIVDFDVVEKKNFSRQLFFKSGVKKGEYLCNELFSEEYKNSNGIDFFYVDMKIRNDIDFSMFDRGDFAFICVDNHDIKVKLCKYFVNYLVCSCDNNSFEIKNVLDKTDYNVFQFSGLNGSYFSNQVFSSNLLCAYFMYRLFLSGDCFNKKINFCCKSIDGMFDKIVFSDLMKYI